MFLNCGVGEDTSESLGVHPKGDQSWVFIGRTDVEAETPILWPPDSKSWLIGKDPDAGKDWRREEKGTTEDEMVGWHHRLWVWVNSGVGDGQGGLACCSPWGHKESDTTEQLKWTNFFHFPDCPFTFLIVSFDAQMFLVGGVVSFLDFDEKKFFPVLLVDISKKPWSNPRSWNFVLIFVSLSFTFSPLKFRTLTHTELIIGCGVKTCLKSFFGIWIASFLSIIYLLNRQLCLLCSLHVRPINWETKC